MIGGWPFILFWSLAAIGVFLEWSAAVQAGRPIQIAGGLALAAAGALAMADHPGWALAAIAAGAVVLAIPGMISIATDRNNEPHPADRAGKGMEHGSRPQCCATGASHQIDHRGPGFAESGRSHLPALRRQPQSNQDGVREDKRLWCATGLLYAGVVLAAPMILRRDPQLGALALFYLFAVVWATDILAYGGGRLIGGPRLAPAISPHKTWSGAVVGMIGGICAGTAVAFMGSLVNPLAAIGLALLLSAAAQTGDLAESAVKRRFGVKDSSRIIPGHGGLMDRLDGFLAAAGIAALLGAARGGLDGAAGGLLIW